MYSQEPHDAAPGWAMDALDSPAGGGEPGRLCFWVASSPAAGPGWTKTGEDVGSLVCMVCQTDFVILEVTPERTRRTTAEVTPAADIG